MKNNYNSKKIQEDLQKKYFTLPIVHFECIEFGIENTNYLIKADGKKFVLRVYNPSRKRNRIQKEIEVMNYLLDNNIPVPKAISSLNQNIIEKIDGKQAVLFSFIQGINPPWEPMNLELAKDIGMNVGKLQLVLLQSKIKVSSLSEFSASIRPKHSSFQNYLEEINQALEQIDLKKLRKGLIHSDITRENIKVNNRSLMGFLDFDDLHKDYLSWDLAIALTHLFVAKSFGIDWKGLYSFLEGYQSVMKLNKQEKHALIPFIMLRNINLLALIEKKSKQDTSKALVSIKDSLLKKIKLIQTNKRRLAEAFSESF